MSIALLFPGQGSQRPGMLHALADHPEVDATLRQASEVLGHDVRDLDEEHVLASTVSTQTAIYTAGVAMARALCAEGCKPAAVAGLSVGAYAAAAASGALAFEDGLRLVRKRAQMMEDMFPSGYGLSAIVGLNERQVAELVAQATTPEHPVFVGNINALDQIVVAGAAQGLDTVVTLAQAAGCKKAERLAVRVPSHCPLLETVAQTLLAIVQDLPPRPVRARYMTNRRARPTKDCVKVREDMATNIAHSVRWHDATQGMVEMGTTLFVEVNPGHVLTRLAMAAFAQVKAMALADNTLEDTLLAIREAQERDDF
jgi:malonate decarboxylase epsilon subunit